jgi:hypothetical protein
VSAANPYAAPKARVEDPIDVEAAAAVRREHIAHETVVRAAGVIAIVGGLLVLAAYVWIAIFGMQAVSLRFVLFYQLVFPLLVVVGVCSIAAGAALLRLSRWGRVAALVLSCVGFLLAARSATFGFRVAPLGVLISACFLFVLLAPKGRRLFAADYTDVVVATPHVQYRTSSLLWVLLAIVVGTSVVFVAAGP